jgi:hypothetical protein
LEGGEEQRLTPRKRQWGDDAKKVSLTTKSELHFFFFLFVLFPRSLACSRVGAPSPPLLFTLSPSNLQSQASCPPLPQTPPSPDSSTRSLPASGQRAGHSAMPSLARGRRPWGPSCSARARPRYGSSRRHTLVRELRSRGKRRRGGARESEGRVLLLYSKLARLFLPFEKNCIPRPLLLPSFSGTFTLSLRVRHRSWHCAFADAGRRDIKGSSTKPNRRIMRRTKNIFRALRSLNLYLDLNFQKKKKKPSLQPTSAPSSPGSPWRSPSAASPRPSSASPPRRNRVRHRNTRASSAERPST